MKIEVHIKDKQFTINCGEGKQKVKWLGDVAIFRHSHFYQNIASTTKGIKLETGEFVDLSAIIADRFQSGTHVWVVLKEDVDNNITVEKSQSVTHNKRPMTGFSRKR